MSLNAFTHGIDKPFVFPSEEHRSETNLFQSKQDTGDFSFFCGRSCSVGHVEFDPSLFDATNSDYECVDRSHDELVGKEQVYHHTHEQQGQWHELMIQQQDQHQGQSVMFRKHSAEYQELVNLCTRKGWLEKLPRVSKDADLALFLKKTGFTRAQVLRKFKEIHAEVEREAQFRPLQIDSRFETNQKKITEQRDSGGDKSLKPTTLLMNNGTVTMHQQIPCHPGAPTSLYGQYPPQKMLTTMSHHQWQDATKEKEQTKKRKFIAQPTQSTKLQKKAASTCGIYDKAVGTTTRRNNSMQNPYFFHPVSPVSSSSKMCLPVASFEISSKVDFPSPSMELTPLPVNWRESGSNLLDTWEDATLPTPKDVSSSSLLPPSLMTPPQQYQQNENLMSATDTRFSQAVRSVRGTRWTIPGQNDASASSAVVTPGYGGNNDKEQNHKGNKIFHFTTPDMNLLSLVRAGNSMREYGVQTRPAKRRISRDDVVWDNGIFQDDCLKCHTIDNPFHPQSENQFKEFLETFMEEQNNSPAILNLV